MHKIEWGDSKLEVEEVNIGGTKVKFFDDFIVGTENETNVSNFENILLNAIKIIMKQDNL